MRSGRFAFTRVQKLQMLSSEGVFVQSKTSLWSFFCRTLCPFYLRWSVLELVQNGGVSTLCLCQRGDVRTCGQ